MKELKGIKTRFDIEEEYEMIACLSESENEKVVLMRNFNEFYILKVCNRTNADKYFRSVQKRMIKLHSNFIVQSSKLNGDSVEFYYGETPFYVYDFIPGITLQQFIDTAYSSNREIKNAIKYKIILGILQGMADMHSKRFVHHGIKTDNIFLDSNFHPHIGEFGEISNNKTTDKHITPETMPKSKVIDISDDFFDFGCILYTIIAKDLTFNCSSGKTKEELMKEIREKVGKSSINIREEDMPLYEVTKICWARNIRNRFTADDLLFDVYEIAKKQLSPEELNEVYEYIETRNSSIEILGNGENVIKAIEKGFASCLNPNLKYKNPLSVISDEFGIEKGSLNDFLNYSTYNSKK